MASSAHTVHRGLRMGPDRELIPLDQLPPPNPKHWVARTKAQVVAAVTTGLLNLEEALARYRLTLDEYLSWQQALSREGVQGLAAGRLMHRDHPRPHRSRRRAHRRPRRQAVA